MADEFCYRSSHKNKCIFGQDFDKRKLLVLYAQSAHVCPAIRIALSSAGATSLAGMWVQEKNDFAEILKNLARYRCENNLLDHWNNYVGNT